ncbi:cholinephosphotransferase 1-like [Amphiura filiformis]|uniref:cholinephosphotransferase 1-like n=1 Tax=Amphiura filiformis TaxID=82378 RepID=UPI003B20DBB9
MASDMVTNVIMSDVLTPSQLKRLKEHKYSAEGQSLCEPTMQVFWRWLVEQIPRTIAPNAITLAGLAFNILGSLILMYYDPTANQDCPSWTYVFAAISLFAYQSLDAIDGKQARRTNSSTPLGELFDHGCDAVSINFVAISCGIALQLGEYPNIYFALFMISMFMFYSAHWQTYVSGTLKFGRLDVTEGQLTFCFIFMCSGVFGPGFWGLKLPIFGIEFKILFFIFGLVTSGLALYNYIIIIFGGGGKGKNGSTVADTSVLSPLFHISAIIAMAMVIKFKSPSRLYERSPSLYLLMFGMVGSKVTNKLVVAHMSKSGMKFLDTSFIGPGLLFINQYLDAPIPEYVVLWIALVYSTLDLARYATVVCSQICQHLNIYCFDIVSKRPIVESSVSSKLRHDSS